MSVVERLKGRFVNINLEGQFVSRASEGNRYEEQRKDTRVLVNPEFSRQKIAA